MGNCSCVCRQTDEDEATDALLNGFEGHHRPRGPPPPYQVSSLPPQKLYHQIDRLPSNKNNAFQW